MIMGDIISEMIRIHKLDYRRISTIFSVESLQNLDSTLQIRVKRSKWSHWRNEYKTILLQMKCKTFHFLNKTPIEICCESGYNIEFIICSGLQRLAFGVQCEIN